MRPNIRYLIIEGLGYCCPWAFFKANPKSAQVIADRLGCGRRIISYWKQDFREGKLQCEKCGKCMLPALMKRPTKV